MFAPIFFFLHPIWSYSHWAFRNWDNFKTVGYMLITLKISCVWAKLKWNIIFYFLIGWKIRYGKNAPVKSYNICIVTADNLIITCSFCWAIWRLRMSISYWARTSFLMERSIPSSSRRVSPNWISGKDRDRCQTRSIHVEKELTSITFISYSLIKYIHKYLWIS